MDKLNLSLKYFFYILRVCGLNAIDLSKSPVKVSKLWATYSVLVLIGYGYFHIATAQVDLKTTKGVNFVATLIDYYNKYSGLVLFVTCILVTLFKQRQLCTLLCALGRHDELFEKHLQAGKINYAKHGRVPIYYLAFHALAVGTFEYNNCIMYIQDFITFNDWCLLMCIVPLFVAVATLVQFAHFVILIQRRLQLLADLLRDQRNEATTQQHLSIGFNWPAKLTIVESRKLDMKVIQQLYGTLFKACQLVNSIFGVQLVVMITTLFVTLTTLSYYICMQVIRLSSRGFNATSDEYQALVGTSLWILLFLLKIFTMCHHSQRVKEQGIACGHYLHHFMLDNRYEQERKTIKMFAKQINQQLFVVSPCGLFTMDMAMGFSIIGATTTYIIILIQFDISQQ